MSAMASQITGVSIFFFFFFCSGGYQRKHQSSASLALVNLQRRPVTRKMFPFDDVIIKSHWLPVDSTSLLGYPATTELLHSYRVTVYPKKYAHGFVVLCLVVVMQSFIMNSHEVFIHIHQGCFAGTGAIVRLPQCQWSKPDGYGKISQCITTTKHSKAKTVCIFLGIYCTNSCLTQPLTRSEPNCWHFADNISKCNFGMEIAGDIEDTGRWSFVLTLPVIKLEVNSGGWWCAGPRWRRLTCRIAREVLPVLRLWADLATLGHDDGGPLADLLSRSGAGGVLVGVAVGRV